MDWTCWSCCVCFGVIRPQATTQQNNLFCFDSVTAICLRRTSRQYFCYVRRLPIVLFLYADCERCLRTDVPENSAATTALIEIGKLSILAWEQCGSNYISSTHTYLKCRCGNLVIFFVPSQNLGYLSDQGTFWNVEAEFLSKHVQIWELLWLIFSELNKWAD